MALVTGSPLGSTVSTSEIVLEGAPNVYYQNWLAPLANNPDSDDFYWLLTGSASYPIYELGCVLDVSLGEDVTVNAVRCDQVGDKDVVQKRNHLVVSLSIVHLLPLTVLSPIMKGGVVTTNATIGAEKMGLGVIDNSRFYHVYLPKVYDEVAGDYVAITLHKCKFVEAFTINMSSGEPWQITGVTIWAFAHTVLPAAQQFATVIRSDYSELGP